MSLFPKVLWPFDVTLSISPWLRISPHSSLNVICCLIITDWQWLISFTCMPCIPMQIKPNKSPLRNRLRALLLWEIGHLSSPSRSHLGRLTLICDSQGSPAGQSSPTGREKERERKINVWLPLMCSPLRTWLATQACAVTGNQTGDLLVHRLVLNPLSYTSQGW